MTAKAIDLEIFGLAAQENERAPFRAAARQLAAWLMTASGAQPNILMTLADDVTALAPATVPRVVIISLISELSSGEMEFADLIKKYRNKCSALASLDNQSVFVCTIFRHIPQQQGPSAAKSRTWMQERIARLNLLTARTIAGDRYIRYRHRPDLCPFWRAQLANGLSYIRASRGRSRGRRDRRGDAIGWPRP